MSLLQNAYGKVMATAKKVKQEITGEAKVIAAAEEKKNALTKAIQTFTAAREAFSATFNPIFSHFMERRNFAPLPFKVPQNILIVGAGGTGGWFAPKIAKIMSDALNKRIVEHQVNVIFVDQDVIETKNLRRQNFVAPDVGRNKAEVIATRYQHSVTNDNVKMGFIPSYLVDKSYDIPAGEGHKFAYIEDVMANCNKESYLVINLIDNMKSRKAIHKFCHKNKVDVIDVANNDYNGQLNFAAYSTGAGHVGSFFAVYPEAAQDNDGIVLYNCADADEAAVDQLFNANDMAATVLGTFLANSIAEGKILFHHVKFCTGVNMNITADNQFMVRQAGEATSEEVGHLGAVASDFDNLVKSF